MYPNDDPDHSKTLAGSKLNTSSDFFQEDPTSGICKILLTYTQINEQEDSHGNDTSLVEVIISCNNPYIIVIREICLEFYCRNHPDRVNVKRQTKVTCNEYPYQVSISYT